MIRRHVTPSLIISLLALFIATSGTSYAVLQIPKKSVGTVQLKPNAVTSKKVKDGSLKAKDFKAGQLPSGATGPQGPAGPQGPTGPQGPAGPQGPMQPANRKDVSDAMVLTNSFQSPATMVLPVGSYVVWSRVNLRNQTTKSQIICSIGNDAAQNVTIGVDDLITITQVATVTLNAAGPVTLNCLRQAGGGTVTAYQRSLTAIPVSSIIQK